MNGKEFKRLREQLGMTTTELGSLLGVSMAALRNWEVGTAKVPGPVSLIMRLVRDRSDLREEVWRASDMTQFVTPDRRRRA